MEATTTSGKMKLTAEALEREMVAYCQLIPQVNNVRADKRSLRFGQYVLNNYSVDHLPVDESALFVKENNAEVHLVLSTALFVYEVKGPTTRIPGNSAEVVSIMEGHHSTEFMAVKGVETARISTNKPAESNKPKSVASPVDIFTRSAFQPKESV